LSTFGLRGLPGDLRVQVFTGGYAPQLVRDVATRDAAADAAASTAGAFPLTASTGDVATVLALEPGTYTAISTSQNEGIGLLELYDITD
jgi:hypothetical protein